MFPLSPMNCSIMLPQTLPGPEHILAEIAGNGHSFQMIGFNVIGSNIAWPGSQTVPLSPIVTSLKTS